MEEYKYEFLAHKDCGVLLMQYQMLNSIILFFSIALCILFVSCTNNYNYEKAYAYEENGQTYIKLKGKRKLATHDLISFISNKKYNDSLMLHLPSLKNGITNGKDILARPGYYKYLGCITIKDNNVSINLSYDNTDDKKIEPLSWNGEYVLIRN